MKIKSLLIATAFLLVTTGSSVAQKAQGQSVFTAGTSFSLASLFINLVKDAVNSSSTITVKSIPAINAMYDYGIAESFSIGAAFSYQAWTVSYSEYTDTLGVVRKGPFKDRASRMNFGIRPLFHFGDNEDLDTYVGARLSFTQWSYKSDARNDLSSSTVFSGANPIKFQALFGMRYFVAENVGLNMEIAIGPTYYAMFGLNLRFGGM